MYKFFFLHHVLYCICNVYTFCLEYFFFLRSNHFIQIFSFPPHVTQCCAATMSIFFPFFLLFFIIFVTIEWRGDVWEIPLEKSQRLWRCGGTLIQIKWGKVWRNAVYMNQRSDKGTTTTKANDFFFFVYYVRRARWWHNRDGAPISRRISALVCEETLTLRHNNDTRTTEQRSADCWLRRTKFSLWNYKRLFFFLRETC